ncbi:MAG: hypothetical protein HC905_21845 [Bacteroidales bacterium]|nr:hypothetical protein [Bacteroidales bacterium]
MKTRLIFLGLTAGILGFFSQANAQVTADPALGFVSKATSSIDTVTVGSIMPYRVTGDINFHALRTQGLFDFSNFNWSLTGGTAGTNYQLRNNTGNAATTPGAKDTVISVNWLLAGSYKVNVQEAPAPATGMPAISCTAGTEEMDVLVVARPTIGWQSANTGGCNVAGTSVNIPVNLTGTGQYEVTYKIDYTPLTGAASNKVASGTKSSCWKLPAWCTNCKYDICSSCRRIWSLYCYH